MKISMPAIRPLVFAMDYMKDIAAYRVHGKKGAVPERGRRSAGVLPPFTAARARGPQEDRLAAVLPRIKQFRAHAVEIGIVGDEDQAMDQSRRSDQRVMSRLVVGDMQTGAAQRDGLGDRQH